jgi:thioesterase domain-containing protein
MRWFALVEGCFFLPECGNNSGCHSRQSLPDVEENLFSPLVPIKPEDTCQPFFCVHPGGGSVLSCFALAEHFPADRPFYGLLAPGLDGDMETLRSVEALAAAHLQAIRSAFPEGPNHLGGHPFGGSVAYEIACQLENERPGLVGALVMLDHAVPARVQADNNIVGEPSSAEALASIGRQIETHFGVELALSAEELSALGDDARLELFLERAKSAGVAPPGATVAMVAGLVSVYQASIYALLCYHPCPLARGLTLFRTAEFAAETADDESAGWSALVRGPVSVCTAEGDHNTMLRAPHAASLAAAVAARIAI